MQGQPPMTFHRTFLTPKPHVKAIFATDCRSGRRATWAEIIATRRPAAFVPQVLVNVLLTKWYKREQGVVLHNTLECKW